MPEESLPYEILLRWKPDGTFSGGHTIRQVNGQLSTALPLGTDTQFPWPAVIGEIETDAFAALSASNDLIASLTVERDALRSQLAGLESSVASLSSSLSEGVAAHANALAELAGGHAAELATNRDAIANLTVERDAFKNQIVGLESSISTLRSSLNEAVAAHANALAELAAIHATALADRDVAHQAAIGRLIAELGVVATERDNAVAAQRQAHEDLVSNEALQTELVRSAKAASDANDPEAIRAVIAAALDSPSIVRARQAAQVELDQANQRRQVAEDKLAALAQ